MSCVVAIVDEGTVYMGADSFVGNTWGKAESRSPKLFRRGDTLIGVVGSVRDMQIARWVMEIPDHHPRKSSEEYMATDFVNALRDATGKAGWRIKDDEREQFGDGQLLIGYKGELFVIAGNFGLVCRARSYEAIGCGEEFALGALWALRDAPPVERITAALDAAAQHSMGVMPPYVIETLKAEGGTC